MRQDRTKPVLKKEKEKKKTLQVLLDCKVHSKRTTATTITARSIATYRVGNSITRVKKHPKKIENVTKTLKI